MDFEKQMRGLRKVNVFLSDHIADSVQPGIQLVRNPGLCDMGRGNDCDSDLRLGMSVALPLWIGRYSPSFGLVGWPSG